MSVINRVLSQLERRGVRIEQDLEMVRAVPLRRSGARLPLLLGLLALTAWWWLGGIAREPEPLVLSAAPQPLAAIAPQPQSGAVATAAVATSSGVPAAVPAASAVLATPQPASRPALQAAAPKPVLPPAPKPAPQPKAAASPAPKPAAPKAGAIASSSSPATIAGKTANKLPAASVRQAAAPKPRPGQQAATPAAELDGMPMKQFSRAQQADAEFRKGAAAMQQGRGDDAVASYQMALQLDVAHDGARQALVALLLDGKRNEEAERLLQERLENRPEHTGFAMLLARLQVERAATGEALVTLERSLPHAGTRPDYLAFLAALQQRNNLHAEAAGHYQAALQLQPDNGAWLMGYGISLQALRRTEEARAAYQKALESKTLSPELKVFIQRKLKAL